MKNNMISYISIFIVGIIIGILGFFLIVNTNGSEISSLDKEQTLYSCGMHPNIIEDEPGTCPICGMNLTPIRNGKDAADKTGKDNEVLYWRAPMDPNEIYDAPGKSKMGMELIPVYNYEAGEQGVVSVDGSTIQNMNIKIEQVKERSIASTIITNGILKVDERNEFSITSKFNGWIEKLYINYTGQRVNKGDKIADIYSPELVAAQQELLSAYEYSNSEMIKNARRKLELLDISLADINQIMQEKKIRKLLTLHAPYKGTVISKYVNEGDMVRAGNEIMRIADLSNMWLTADIYESDINKVELNSKVTAEFDFNPGKKYGGEIFFIDPVIDKQTRTVKIRADLKNSEYDLKPGMFGRVEISGKDLEKVQAIPEYAVIRSGRNNRVILSLGNGKFKPAEVQLGLYSNGYYQVLSGLNTGDNIVTSGQFMIDSESSLRAAINVLSSKNDASEDHMAKQVGNKEESSIIREGIINLQSIDANNDGRLFECPMDWNVISDSDGRCPICNMFLKEYGIEEVKMNLSEHNYEYE